MGTWAKIFPMTNLSQADISRVVDVLSKNASWSNEGTRRSFLTLALHDIPRGGDLIDTINLVGARTLTASESVLAIHGAGFDFFAAFVTYLLDKTTNSDAIAFLSTISQSDTVPSSPEDVQPAAAVSSPTLTQAPKPKAQEQPAPSSAKKAETKQPESKRSEDTQSLIGFSRTAPYGLNLVHSLSPNKVSNRGTITRISWSPDGVFIAAPSHNGMISIWNVKMEKQVAILVGHEKAVYSVAWTGDSKRLVSCSWDNSIRVWDVRSGKGKVLYDKLSGPNALALKPGTSVIAVGAEHGPVLLLDIESGKRVEALLGHRGNINNLAWSPNGDYLAGASGDSAVHIWAMNKAVPVVSLKGHGDWAFSVAWSPDGKVLASGSWDDTIRCWDVEAGRELCVLEAHTGRITSCSFSPDGKVLASKSHDNTVKLWRCDTWAEVAQIEEGSSRRGSSSLAFHPTLPILATLGDKDVALRVWELESAKLCESRGVEATRRYVNAKVVLLGEGTVGKTSLAHRLIEDRYVVQDRTHGMNVWRLDLPLPPDATLEREALLWDLAGQEDYRLIHQLFLEETALALMLVNPQNPDPFVDVGSWLKALKTANNPEAKRDAARLLIFSQIDVGGMKLGNAKIDRFQEQHGFTDWLPTSAKTGENCSDEANGGQPSKLKQLIAGSIPWDKLPWTSTPRRLAELKNAVMAMRDESDIRLLRFSELAQRLEQALLGEKFAEPDVRTAVTLLANHGLARPLKFGDLVLLRPDLINGYAGAVIRAARAHTDEIGCVLEADIYRPDFDFTGVERLKHRPDEELLLRALVQTFLDHSLCIAEDTPHGRHLVFPSQYRREKDIPHEPDIFVSYSFSGEWQTVWTTLVVRLWYSQGFAHRELWRNAAEFESARQQTLGLKITKTGDGAATISLYFDHEVPDELKVIFIEYIHRHLAKYACEVTRDRRYVCPDCGTPVKNLDAVRRRREAKKDFINCQECDDVKIPFIDFIEKQLKSDPVAQKILAMDETATRELDTQALEQILIGHMMAIAGEANQIFRLVTMFEHGIDGEVEFKDNDGKASGKRIYIQLKSGNSYLRTRKSDGSEVFDVKDDRHLTYWISQPVDVYLVIRQTDELSGQQVIRWMNVTRDLKARKDKKSRQIIFVGEKLDMGAVYRVRDGFFPAR